MVVTAETLRRWPFFAGLEGEHLKALARVAKEMDVADGDFFFHEGDELDKVFLNLDGKVDIVIEALDRDVEPKIAEQLMRDLKTKHVVVSTLQPGEIFGWSSLVPPHTATAGAKAVGEGTFVALDATKLREVFEQDCQFGYLVMQKAAQVVRRRLRDTRIESLSVVAQ